MPATKKSHFGAALTRSDLNEDGNSDLTANCSFTDGTTASMTWFYADGGFIYNEEFSVLPGNAPAGNAE